VTVQPVKFKKGSEPNFRIWKQYRVEEGEFVYIGIPISNNGSEIINRVNLKVYQESKLIKEENITSLGILKTVVITVQWKANFLGEFQIKAVASVSGDSNVQDNTAQASIKVVEKEVTTIGGTENPWSLEPGKPLFLVLIIVIIIGILATVRYMLSLRAEQSARDLYESIYGDDLVGGAKPGGPGDDAGGEGGGASVPQDPEDTRTGTIGPSDEYSSYSDYDFNK
jgi:hypothetical protein